MIGDLIIIPTAAHVVGVNLKGLLNLQDFIGGV
jgi:hypothetical protein